MDLRTLPFGRHALTLAGREWSVLRARDGKVQTLTIGGCLVLGWHEQRCFEVMGVFYHIGFDRSMTEDEKRATCEHYTPGVRGNARELLKVVDELAETWHVNAVSLKDVASSDDVSGLSFSQLRFLEDGIGFYQRYGWLPPPPEASGLQDCEEPIEEAQLARLLDESNAAVAAENRTLDMEPREGAALIATIQAGFAVAPHSWNALFSLRSQTGAEWRNHVNALPAAGTSALFRDLIEELKIRWLPGDHSIPDSLLLRYGRVLYQRHSALTARLATAAALLSGAAVATVRDVLRMGVGKIEIASDLSVSELCKFLGLTLEPALPKSRWLTKHYRVTTANGSVRGVNVKADGRRYGMIVRAAPKRRASEQ